MNYEQSKLVKNELFTSTVVSVSQLVTQAKWQNAGGDRSSYFALKSLPVSIVDKKFKNIVESQIRSLENSYESWIVNAFVEQLKFICKYLTVSGPACSKGFIEKNDFRIHNLLDHLDPNKLWQERVKAAHFLRYCKTANDFNNYQKTAQKEKVYQELVNHMKMENESSLLVSKMAFETYKSLSGFKTTDVFGFDAAIEHWEKNKEEIINKNF
ncbi:MAG: hypothetical protein ABIH08_03520 [Candidatus Omnitrophota bacterium]